MSHFRSPFLVLARLQCAGRALQMLGLLLVLLQAVSLRAGVIDFEGFPDSTILTTQYPSLTFSNTIILSAGISLNEFELPPRSGTNVAFDNSGPISIAFATPVLSFGGFFTYAVPLTLAAFDASSAQVDSASSAFSSNLALSGNPGSGPNEFLQVSFATGISSITITGDPAGGSFALDDSTITSGARAVPEPSSIALVLSGTACFFAVCRLLLIMLKRHHFLFFICLFALTGSTIVYGWTRLARTDRSYQLVANQVIVYTNSTTTEQRVAEIAQLAGGGHIEPAGFPNVTAWIVDVPKAKTYADTKLVAKKFLSYPGVVTAEVNDIGTLIDNWQQ